MDEKQESFIGFEEVIKYLINYKKPIILHNSLFDLLYLY